MPNYSIGTLMIEDDSGNRVLATPEMLVPFIPPGFGYRPGKGRHPLVRVELPVTIFSMEKPEGLRDWGEGLLYERFTGRVSYFGSCLAANDNGLLYIEWSLAARSAMKRSRAMSSWYEGSEFVAVVPEELPLPRLPARLICMYGASGNPVDQEVVFLHEFQPQMVGSVPITTVQVPAGKRLRDREQGLVSIGMQVEKYVGLPPTGVRYAPMRDRNQLG